MKADKVRARNQKKGAAKSLNPFEQQHSKNKFVVLGRKEKNSKGTPGASRNKADKQRKATGALEWVWLELAETLT